MEVEINKTLRADLVSTSNRNLNQNTSAPPLPLLSFFHFSHPQLGFRSIFCILLGLARKLSRLFQRPYCGALEHLAGGGTGSGASLELD